MSCVANSCRGSRMWVRLRNRGSYFQFSDVLHEGLRGVGELHH